MTNTAGEILTVDGSLRAIEHLVGYPSLQTTERYIEGDSAAQEAGGRFGLTKRWNCI